MRPDRRRCVSLGELSPSWLGGSAGRTRDEDHGGTGGWEIGGGGEVGGAGGVDIRKHGTTASVEASGWVERTTWQPRGSRRRRRPFRFACESLPARSRHSPHNLTASITAVLQPEAEGGEGGGV